MSSFGPALFFWLTVAAVWWSSRRASHRGRAWLALLVAVVTGLVLVGVVIALGSGTVAHAAYTYPVETSSTWLFPLAAAWLPWLVKVEERSDTPPVGWRLPLVAGIMICSLLLGAVFFAQHSISMAITTLILAGAHFAGYRLLTLWAQGKPTLPMQSACLGGVVLQVLVLIARSH